MLPIDNWACKTKGENFFSFHKWVFTILITHIKFHSLSLLSLSCLASEHLELMGLVCLNWSWFKVRRLRVRQPISIYSLPYKTKKGIIILLQEKIIHQQWYPINNVVYQGCFHTMISLIYLRFFCFLLIARIAGFLKQFSLISFPRSLI